MNIRRYDIATAGFSLKAHLRCAPLAGAPGRSATLGSPTGSVSMDVGKGTRLPMDKINTQMTYKVTTCMSKQDIRCLQPPQSCAPSEKHRNTLF